MILGAKVACKRRRHVWDQVNNCGMAHWPVDKTPWRSANQDNPLRSQVSFPNTEPQEVHPGSKVGAGVAANVAVNHVGTAGLVVPTAKTGIETPILASPYFPPAGQGSKRAYSQRDSRWAGLRIIGYTATCSRASARSPSAHARLVKGRDMHHSESRRDGSPKKTCLAG